MILNQDLSIMPRRFMEFQEKISYHLRNGSHSWTLDKIQKSSGWNGAQTAEYAYFQNNILPGVIRQLCGWLTYGKPVTLTAWDTFKNVFKTRFHRNASIVERMNLGETLFPGKIDKNETRLCGCAC